MRMPRRVCQPPATLSASLRFGSLRWVKVSTTSWRFAFSWKVTSDPVIAPQIAEARRLLPFRDLAMKRDTLLQRLVAFRRRLLDRRQVAVAEEQLGLAADARFHRPARQPSPALF